MRAPAFVLLLLVCPVAFPPALAQSAPRPARLGLCVSCHGETGRSNTRGTPHIGGQDQAYLASSLQAYRNGSRKAEPMNSIANMLPPKEIAALAAWYARQPGFARP